jgi:choline dehydrogenase-like flavoprotein
MLRGVLRRAGFYAVPFARQNSNAALTYHFGATFPMRANPKQPNDTDVLGRPFGSSRIHVVDTSVLPAIPATTVGLLTMANAHRIAAQSINL